MKDEPSDISCDDVAGFLAEYWGIRATEVTYAAVGGGCYHWIGYDEKGPCWFVTGNYLEPRGSWLGPTAERTRIAVEAAMSATNELAASGYEFVVAPLPDLTGMLIRQIAPGWLLLVLPYLDGWSTKEGDWTDPVERDQIAAILGRLHTAPQPKALRRWDFAVPGRDALLTALGQLDQRWIRGPYGEPTRRRLAAAPDHVHGLFERYDALSRRIKESSDPWVVTHGEPHSGNVVRTADGRMYLIDWDTAQLAPRERDLAALHEGPAQTDCLTSYRAEAGPVDPRPEAIEMFHIWWALAEIAGCVQIFRDPHGDSADMAQNWRNLAVYVPG